jgi:hypothetical protein
MAELKVLADLFPLLAAPAFGSGRIEDWIGGYASPQRLEILHTRARSGR